VEEHSEWKAEASRKAVGHSRTSPRQAPIGIKQKRRKPRPANAPTPASCASANTPRDGLQGRGSELILDRAQQKQHQQSSSQRGERNLYVLEI